MKVPSSTIDLIKVLKEKYEDKLVVDAEVVGTPEYWKNAGVVELLRELTYYIEQGGK
jgi:hypothetical protein